MGWPFCASGFTARRLCQEAQAAIELSRGTAQYSCVKKTALVLDDTDHQLLDELQADAGRTLRELGEVVGLSPSAVQRRMGRYRASGLLSRLSAVLDPRFSPDLVLVVCLVQVERESRRLHEAYNRRLLAAPEVQQAYTVYGE